MIVFVNNDMGLQELFFHTFHQTNQVFCFSDMYDAYKWAKKNKKSPSIIISEVDLQDPSGLQAIKFILANLMEIIIYLNLKLDLLGQDFIVI